MFLPRRCAGPVPWEVSGWVRCQEVTGEKKRIGASERYERYIQHLWLVDWLRIYVKFQSRLRSACSWSKIISWWSRSPEARTNVVHRRSSRPWLGASSKQAVATPRRETRECPAQQLGSGRLRDWNDLRWWIGSIINMFFRWPCEMKKFRDTWIVSDCPNLDQSLVQVESIALAGETHRLWHLQGLQGGWRAKNQQDGSAVARSCCRWRSWI